MNCTITIIVRQLLSELLSELLLQLLTIERTTQLLQKYIQILTILKVSLVA